LILSRGFWEQFFPASNFLRQWWKSCLISAPNSSASSRVARWFIFRPKIPLLVNFLGLRM
jgi:hypothetical protein